jgi:uncharacterized membrane protein YdjX (TVP38/TMEM64 family)
MNLLESFAARLETLGPWAPFVFIAVYVVASVAFIPGSLLTLVAGAVFGLSRAIPLVFISAVLGSSAAFAIARVLAHDRVVRWLQRDARSAAVLDAVGGQGWRVVFLLRLSPLFPFNLLNYALGVSTVSYRDFLIGSIGMLPGTILYVYYGKVIGDVTAVAAGIRPPRGVEYYVFLACGLIATVIVTVTITRAARKRLGPRLDR